MTLTAERPEELRWTIDELGRAAAAAVALAGIGQSNGQVREVPDRRTLRYYTALGLLGRPVEMRGRTAFYGVVHLRQVVAVKRLQADGLTLRDIQARLAGLGSGELAALADVPEAALLSGPAAASTPRDSGPSRRDAAFWEAEAAEPQAGEPAGPTAPAAEEGQPPRGVEPTAASRLGPGVVATALLDGGALLVLPGAPALDEGDLEAIRLAAGPLLSVLKQRGLLGAPPNTQGGPE